MEWPLKVNEIFDEQVTRITGAAMLPKNFSADVRTSRAVQDLIGQLIDQLGKESAVAQGLNKVITSAEKLRLNPAHIVYLLKDFRGDKGKGEIIGLLKVGRKHLFLLDTKEVVHEVETLCVLDFYVVGHKQRLGYGRLLFDFMLHELELTANQMAIDGPSDKMELFLKRNYGITNLLRQSNNFAVAPSFFERTDKEISNTGRDLAVEPAAAIGRFAATKPTSAIANVIHGAGYDNTTHRLPSPADVADAAPEPSAEAEQWSDEELDDDSRVRYALDLEHSQQPARGPPGRRSPALERPDSLSVQPGAQSADVPAAGMPSAAATPSGTGGTRDPQLTDKGYFDVKYFHNRLCSSSADGASAQAGAVAVTGASAQAGTGAVTGSIQKRKPCAVDAQSNEYYGFTPMDCITTDDEGSEPEIDDETYERCYFDMDQPSYERRDERRAQFRYSPPALEDARVNAPPDTQLDAPPDTQPDAQPKTQFKAETGAQPNAQPGAQSKAQPGAQSKAQPGAQPKAQPKSQPKAKPKRKRNSNVR